MSNIRSKVLGKGLVSLLKDAPNINKNSELNIIFLATEHMRSGKFQPRKEFNASDLQELSDSIQINGIIQPILVRKNEDEDGYEIIAGERRWRASKMAGLKEVPVIIKKINDKSALEISIIENVQRKDLNYIEEAMAYKKLMNEFLYRQDDISKIVCKSRSHIANILRLLLLPEKIKEMVSDNKLSMGHARALINLDKAEDIADEIVKAKLSVRETEALIKQLQSSEKKVRDTGGKLKTNPSNKMNCDIKLLEDTILEKAGLDIRIKELEESSGTITIKYSDLQELERIVTAIAKHGGK